MKIGLVSPFSFTYHGGVQKHVWALYQKFKNRGLDCKIIAPRQNKDEDYGPDVLLLGFSFVVPANATRGDISFAQPWEVEAVLAKHQFNLLHFHSLSPLLPSQIIWAAEKFRIKKVYTSHSNPDKSFLMQNLPFVVQSYFSNFLANVDGVISVSQVASLMVQEFKGPQKRVPNGVDLGFFTPRGERVDRFIDDQINLLFVGRLDERKGVLVLIKAFAVLSKIIGQLRLIIVGEGFLSERARELVRELNLANVEFLGSVPDAELPKYYRTAHIFCAPAIGAEAFGLVLLEAMASGLPVVASRIEGYKEVLTGEGADLLHEAGEVEALAATVSRLAASPDLREKYGRWGLATAKDYSWEKVADQVLSFYTSLT